MKVPNIIIFVSLFAIVLLVSQAEAQSDSLDVNLHFHGEQRNCYVTMQSQGDIQVSIPNTIEAHVRIASGDSVYSSSKRDRTAVGFSWSIDVVRHQFRNFKVFFDMYEVDSNLGCIATTHVLHGAGNDWFPYSEVGGAMIVPRVAIPCTGGYAVDLSYFYPNWYKNDSGRTLLGSTNSPESEFDTIAIEIIPSLASVSPYVTKNAGENLYASYDRSGGVTFTYHPVDFSRDLRILDLRGRTIGEIPVRAQSESLFLPILNTSPGPYFARLGNQIAKLIVPPR